jgi:hypothetical protein
MARTFTGWLDTVGDQVSKLVEEQTGRVTLLVLTDAEEDELYEWFLNGVKPKDAAQRYLLCILEQPGWTWKEVVS